LLLKIVDRKNGTAKLKHPKQNDMYTRWNHTAAAGGSITPRAIAPGSITPPASPPSQE